MVDSTAAGSMRDVVPDVIDNQSAIEQPGESEYGPMPPIQRLDMETDKKLLTIDSWRAFAEELQVFSCADGSNPRGTRRFFLAAASHVGRMGWAKGSIYISASFGRIRSVL